MFSHIYIRRLRYSARYNQLQKEPFFAHKGSLYCCKISDKKLQFQCNVKTVSLYVKMPLRDFNSFCVFLMILGAFVFIYFLLYSSNDNDHAHPYLSFFSQFRDELVAIFVFLNKLTVFFFRQIVISFLLSDVNCWFQFGQSS